MFERLRVALAHPELIGLYFKDKLSHAFPVILFTFLLYSLVLGILVFSTSYFPYSVSTNISGLVRTDSIKANLKLENNILTGDAYFLESADFKAYFLDENIHKRDREIVIEFKEDHASVYRNNTYVSSYKYNDTNIDFTKIQATDYQEIAKFEVLIENILNTASFNYSLIGYFSNIFTILGYAAMLFFGLVFITGFFSPGISTNVRIKMCVYLLPIYFVIMAFSLLFRIVILQYVALIVPIIYGKIAFSRIIVIKKNKN